jgi:O-antigen/teichoic acid export membrane protein
VEIPWIIEEEQPTCRILALLRRQTYFNLISRILNLKCASAYKIVSVKSALDQLKNSVLARNTLWMFLGLGSRIVIQAAYFVVIARSLGPAGYGTFVGVVAFVQILVPFASLGGGQLLIKNVATSAELFARYWGNALAVTLLIGSLLTGAVLWLSQYILPNSIPPLLILSIAVADLLFSRVLEVSGQAFQAFQRLGWTAQLQVMLSLMRLGAALGLVILSTSPTPVEWGVLYLLSTAVSSSIGIWLVHLKLGKPRLDLGRVVSELREGFYFSFGLSAQSIYNDIDKTMLARLSTLEATGIYAAAYRLIDVSFTPVRSLLGASFTRFFQHGAAGIRGSFSFAKRLLPVGAAYGLFAGVALYLTAPLLPYLLGADYQNAVEAVRWLSLLPFLKAMHYLLADALTGAGFQGLRSGLQGLVALFNVAINLVLIPVFSWHGAAWASIGSDAFLVLGLCAMLWYIYRRERVRVE